MIKYIACEVYRPYIEHLNHLNKRSIDIDYLPIVSHDHPKMLNKTIQKLIDNYEEKYDEIILLYGICGNATSGIISYKAKLKILAVHDCLAMLLGSKVKYKDIIENSGLISYSCISYQNQMINQDNTGYYIDTGLTKDNKYVRLYDDSKVIKGSLTLINDAIELKNNILVSKSCGEQFDFLYDLDIVIK